MMRKESAIQETGSGAATLVARFVLEIEAVRGRVMHAASLAEAAEKIAERWPLPPMQPARAR